MKIQFALTGVLVAWAAALSAQEQPASERLHACRTIGNAEERLACFDREMSALDPVAPAASSVEAPTVAPAPEAAGAAAAGAAVVADAEPAPVATREAAAAPTPIAESPPAASPAPIADVQPTPATDAIPDDFGLKSEGPVSFSARIADFRRKPYGELLILLDNGQIWEQKHRDTSFKIDIGDEVQVSEGLISGYRLTGVENQQTIQITRIK